MLRLRLEPEEIPLRARRELQGIDATVRGGLAGRLIRDEASIGGDHHEIQLGLGVGSAPGAPAEVHQFIFGVEVDVSRRGLGLGHIRGLARVQSVTEARGYMQPSEQRWRPTYIQFADTCFECKDRSYRHCGRYGINVK